MFVNFNLACCSNSTGDDHHFGVRIVGNGDGLIQTAFHTGPKQAVAGKYRVGIHHRMGAVPLIQGQDEIIPGRLAADASGQIQLRPVEAVALRLRHDPCVPDAGPHKIGHEPQRRQR